jgi:ssDNA-binding Zn-finger/Zn-ribbon topoisomerase 1
MASMVERRRISCPICHVNAYIVKFDDGSHVIKCTNKQRCGNTCPYLKDPDYRSPYRRAPEYMPQ